MRKVILLISILLLFSATIEPFALGVSRRIVILPFYDESGYRGPWDLKKEVPGMIGDMIGGADDYFYVVPMDSVIAVMDKPKRKNAFRRVLGLFLNRKERQKFLTDTEMVTIGRRLQGDVIITGVIEDFNFHRWGGGEPMIGGYKSYTSKVQIEQIRVLRISDGSPLGTVRGEEEKTVRGLGLELFGKPRQMDVEFYSLDSLDFGSKRFLGSLMGQTTVEALNKVHKELRSIIARPDSNWYSEKKFRILSVSAGTAAINAGSADGITPGDIFVVYASESGARVGKINVITVWSDHVSQVQIIDGQDTIRPDDRIMPEF